LYYSHVLVNTVFLNSDMKQTKKYIHNVKRLYIKQNKIKQFKYWLQMGEYIFLTVVSYFLKVLDSEVSTKKYIT